VFFVLCAVHLAGLTSYDLMGRGPERGSSTKEAEARQENTGERKGNPSAFSLFPKALQTSPMLDMTVFTEMTGAGREIPAPSAERPVYYVAQPDGFKQLGAAVGGEKPPSAAHMDYFIRKALAAAGYRSVPSTEIRPTLLIRYYWGTHNVLGEQMSSDFPDFADDDALERARLVGGRNLVREMARVMESGETIAERDETKDYLKTQAFNDLYFVVVHAYDYEASVRGKRVLYWKTSMTVNAGGVSVRESLPPLVASGAPFLGRETKEVAITSKRLQRKEKVEIGEETILGVVDDAVVTPPAKAPNEKKE
jgi:hypothetical protein